MSIAILWFICGGIHCLTVAAYRLQLRRDGADEGMLPIWLELTLAMIFWPSDLIRFWLWVYGK
jgi:hypothetical protein